MSDFKWFRSWHGAPIDPKYLVIAARAGVKVGLVSALMWALLDYASQHENRGSVEGFDHETYAAFTGFPEAEIVATMQAMNDKGIIKDGRLTNWEKRQPKREDDSYPRVRAFREKKRNVTQSNDIYEGVTLESTSTLNLNLDSSLNSSLNDEGGENWTRYSKAFSDATGLPELTGGPQKFYKAIEAMVKAGVEPCDITQAVADMKAKDFTIASISSIINPSIIAMGNRKKPAKSNGSKADKQAEALARNGLTYDDYTVT